MNIIPHRGIWGNEDQKNSIAAISDALEFFDGVELDLRDHPEGIIVAHDPFSSGALLQDILADLSTSQRKKFFALNIKADGLASGIQDLLTSFGIRHYGCFDLSFPEKKRYLDLGLKVLDRRSDLETNPTTTTGEVVDCFEYELPVQTLNLSRLQFLISPELHGRDPAPYWRELKQSVAADSSKLFICTDFPFELEEFWRNG